MTSNMRSIGLRIHGLAKSRLVTEYQDRYNELMKEEAEKAGYHLEQVISFRYVKS